MNTWEKYKISEIGEVVGGATPSTSIEEYYGGNIPWLTPKDLSSFNGRYISRGGRNITEKGLNSCSARLLPAGSILFSSRAPIGYVAIAKNPISTNQGFKSIIPSEKVNNIFLFYLLKFNKENIELMGSGTTFKEVSGATMKNIEVQLPSLEIQKKIADILSSLDDKIELNNKINNNLEKQAQAIFKSWFVDFGPFQDGEFVESELGMIPKGWRVGCVGDYCKVRSGFAFKSSWWQDKGVRVIKIKNIDGTLNLNDCSFVSLDKINPAKEFIVKGGDLLIAMTGATLGKFAIVPQFDKPLLVNQRVGKFFIGNEPLQKLPFIYSVLKQERIYNEIVNKGQGSAQPNISSSDIESTKIVLSPPETIEAYNQKYKKYYEMVIANILENKKIKTLRDSLLPKLMSGELSVEDI